MVSKLDRLIETYHSPECEFDADRSIEVCKEILKINPNLIEFQENLACSYYDKKEYEKSIELYKKCLEKGGNSDYSYLIMALAYLKLNKNEKAFETIEKTKDIENYFFNYFRIYNELKDYDNAIEYGDMVLELNPENTMTLVMMSNIYNEIDDFERSIFYFEELARIVPQAKPTEIIRLYSMNEYDRIIEIFEDPKNQGIFDDSLEGEMFNFIIGASYYELNKPYESLKYLLESDRLKEEVDKKMLIAKNYIELNQFDNAHRYLMQALEIDEMDETCLFLITETSYFRGEYLKAIEYANKLLSNYTYEKAFHVLGAIYYDLGENEKAFENILLGTHLMEEMEDEYDDYILEIASRLSKAGLSKRAEYIYNAIEEKAPQYIPIYLEQAKHYKRIGRDDLSRKYYKKYNAKIMKNRKEFGNL